MPQRQSSGRGNPENLDPGFAEIAKALAGVDLPKDRDGLYSHAEENGAEDEILSVLESLPDRDYVTMAEVIEEVGISGKGDEDEDEESDEDEEDDEDEDEEDSEDEDEDEDEEDEEDEEA